MYVKVCVCVSVCVLACVLVCMCSRKRDVRQMRQMGSRVCSRPLPIASRHVNSLKSFVGEMWSKGFVTEVHL